MAETVVRVSALDVVGVRTLERSVQTLPEARRQLLATLVAAGPDGLSIDAAADGVWPHELPTSWEAALRMGFTRLRALVGAAAVVHQNSWCRLDLPISHVDTWELATLANQSFLSPTDVRRAVDLAIATPFPDLEVSPIIRKAISETEADQRAILLLLAENPDRRLEIRHISALERLAAARPWDDEARRAVSTLRAGLAPIDAAKQIIEAATDHGPGCVLTSPSATTPTGEFRSLLDDIEQRIQSSDRTVIRMQTFPGPDVAFGPLVESVAATRPAVAEYLASTEPESERITRCWMAILDLLERRGRDVTFVIDDLTQLDRRSREVVGFLLRCDARIQRSVVVALPWGPRLPDVVPGWPPLVEIAGTPADHGR